MRFPSPLCIVAPTNPARVYLRRDFSIFLDSLRVSAAAVVFLGHFSLLAFGGGWLRTFAPLGHSAVVVFFVLSGYVIAWTARRDASAVNYLVGRAARIYSVALPALMLTFVLDVLTGNLTYQHAQPWKYVPLFLTFSTDFWFLKENAFSNVPWWSLCYEVWFYVLFGIVFFGRGARRWVFATLTLAIMGPRLWLLFPIWLLGAALHGIRQVSYPRLVLASALIAIIALKLSGIEFVLNEAVNASLGGYAKTQLRYSQFFLGDYVLASLVAAAIAAARDADLSFLKAQKFIAAPASISFSLYLTHYPLLLALNYAFPMSPLAVGALALACAIAFGFVFERNKKIARRLIAGLLGRFHIAPAVNPTCSIAENGPLESRSDVSEFLGRSPRILVTKKID